MYRMLIRAVISLMLLSFGLSSHASPSLIGDRVNISLSGDAGGFFFQSLVTNNYEVDPYGNQNYRLDVLDSSIVFTVMNGPFCGFQCNGGSLNVTVSDLDWIGFPLALISSASLSNVGGGDGFGLSFGSDYVSFRVLDTNQFRGEQVRIDLVVDEGVRSPPPSPVAVPEPASYMLALSGLALMSGINRRRRFQGVDPTVENAASK